jgi:hypothetical protein
MTETPDLATDRKSTMRLGFEESQFAVFFQNDLTHRNHNGVELAPIGQVLEAQLGFDLGGWLPPAHPIWGSLNSPALPGLSTPIWNPSLSATAAVSSKALNVFFQFKRSHHLSRRNAKYFNALGGPYLRFQVDRTENVGNLPQHELLEQLELRTKGFGLVRYVAPICHTYDKLESLCDSRGLLEECVYVAPTRFQPNHTTCAYTSPTNMIVNPGPEETRADTWTDIRGALADLSPGAVDVEELIGRTTELAYSLGARSVNQMRYPWRLSRRLPSEARGTLQNYLPAAELFFRTGLDWLVALVPAR